MISLQRLLPFVIVLLVLFGLVRLFRYAQQYDPGAERLATGGAPEVSLLFEDATIVSRTRGITEWTLPVDRIEVRSPIYGGLDSYSSVDFRGINNGKLYRAGKLEATVSAQSALYEQQSGSFTIGGPLKLVSGDQDRLDAESCIWTERNDEVRLGKGVRAVVQGHSLRSPFVLFSPRRRTVNCPQGAEGVFDTETLRASNLVWDINRSLVECRGPVSGEGAGRSWSAQSARMELTGERTGSEKQTHVKRLIANDVNMQDRIEGEEFERGSVAMKTRGTVIGAAAVTLISGRALALQNPPKKTPPTQVGQAAQAPNPAQPKKRLLNIRAATAIHEEATNTDDLTNAVIEDMDEGTVFRADQVKIDNMNSVKTADATGNLLVTDKQADVTGENVKVYFAKSKRLLVLTGKVVVQLKPKSEQKDPTPGKVEPMPVVLQNGKPRVEAPDSGDDTSAESARKYPATITCDKLEYEYAKSKKHAVLTGNFKVVQKFPDHIRTLWADHADYYGLEDRVMLHAPVRWEDTKNDQKGSSPEDVEVYTRDGDERLKAKKIELTVQVEEEGDDKPPASKSGQEPPDSKPDAKGSAKPDEKNPNPSKTGPDKKALH